MDEATTPPNADSQPMIGPTDGPPTIRPHAVPATAPSVLPVAMARRGHRHRDRRASSPLARSTRRLTGKKIPRLLDRGSADDVRAVLATIAGASITTLALVLSITMVVLTMAATQFGPRLIRGFLGSRATKVTISLFAGLFVYSILVLDSIRTGEEGPELIPEIGTSVTLLVTFTAVMALIWYVHDVAQSIQLNQVVNVIAHDLATAIVATREDRENAAPGRDPVEVEAEWMTMADRVDGGGPPGDGSRGRATCNRSTTDL